MNATKNFNIGLIGHMNHGKTSLMIAMMARAKALGRPTDWPFLPTIMVQEHRKMLEKAKQGLEK